MSVLPALTPWQQRAYAQAAEALDAGRMGHALLISGPARLGKRVVAEKLAQRALCRARAPGEDACGQCRSCTLFLSRAQSDPLEVRPGGELAHPFGKPGHPDAWFIGYAVQDKSPYKPRTEITIDQVRALSEKLGLTPQLGGAQVALVDPADAMNQAAANGLLKTLEEPHPGRYLWLLASDPARLPATIRSRCQQLEFRLPPADEAAAWLQAQGHPSTAAREALAAARGHPGLADAWLRDGSLALRRAVAADLESLRAGRAAPSVVAQAWAADEQAGLRLRFAADLALDEAEAEAAAGLTAAGRTRRLAAWFDAANRTGALLRTTVRADLSIAELLLAWQETR